MGLSNLLLRHLLNPQRKTFFSQTPVALRYFSSLSTDSTNNNDHHQSSPKPSSLSARMSFIFEQIDEIDKKREEKDQTLHRIRAWRESKKQQTGPEQEPADPGPTQFELESELVKSEELLANSNAKKNEVVEVVHPWAEWVELMERLVQQNYFDHRRKDEEGMMESLSLDCKEAGVAVEDKGGRDFMRDFKTVQAAVINFGRDRFDILRSLSRQDLQILVGYGCPSEDKKVVFSSKLLRKHVHLDEGDVCSSCSLRSSCERAYLLTNKEDEARTNDVMRVLLAYGFDLIDGSVTNKSLLKMKTVKTVIRKLLHEVVKLSAVPIDPNLPPPVIKRPPPKVKQPPPPPKKRVGRDDIEMKKGDWLCPKCDFMNFAKNTVCLQCDAKRPKRQLLPGEWECPQCNFLNYRRNTVCFHCEHKRPHDTYTENQFPENQRGPRMRMDKIPNKADVSDAWNFDFDDNESDGADVAAFEYANSQKLDEDFSLNKHTFVEKSRGHEDGFGRSNRAPQSFARGYSESGPMRPGVGFNDFDEEDEDDIDSYELVAQNEVPKISRIDFSELEADSESEDIEGTDGKWNARGKTSSTTRGKKQVHRKASMADSEDDQDFDTDDDLPTHPKWKSSHAADVKKKNRDRHARVFGSDDDDLGFSSGSDDETFSSKKRGNRWGSKGMDRRPSSRDRDRHVRAFGSEDDDLGFSSGFDNETLSTKGRGWGSKGMDRKPSSRADTFSEIDSDDDLSDFNDNQRNRRGRNGPGKASRGRGGSLNSGFSRSSGSHQYDRGTRDNTYNGKERNSRGGKSSKFRGRRQGGSFNKRGGRSENLDNQSDGYMVDERYRRPRMNVR